LALDYIPRPDDAADALAIAITGWMNLWSEKSPIKLDY
jgi:Holliday junction resolvasome RuvABC endonuclease subunit